MTLIDEARAYTVGCSDDGVELINRLLVKNARLEAAIMQSDALRRAWRDSSQEIDAERNRLLEQPKQLMEEMHRVNKEIQRMETEHSNWRTRATSAEAERDRLAEALKQIAEAHSIVGFLAHDLTRIARAALAEQKDAE